LGGSAEKGVSFGGEHGRGQLLEKEELMKSTRGKRGKCEGGNCSLLGGYLFG